MQPEFVFIEISKHKPTFRTLVNFKKFGGMALELWSINL